VLPTHSLEPTRARSRHRLRTAAVVLAAALLGPGAADTLAASGPTTLAYTHVDRMVQSTGNLYWTSHYRDEFNPPTATVYRASKWNTPGSERALYTETGTGAFYFGDLTYANAGDYYAYFVANYPDTGTSQIKRVPLAGGSVVTLATSPAYIGLRDIDTDGSSLYWADGGGLRKMPLGGGPVTTLDARTNISVLGLDATRVIYGTGPEIRSVAKTGGQPRWHHTARATITAMDVVESSDGKLYWGQQDGTVTSGQLRNNGIFLDPAYQTLWGARSVRSVAFDGSRVLWADCAYPTGTNCIVRKFENGRTVLPSSGTVGADNLLGDATAMFWSDPQPKRYVH
jgi:hypothetical protein